MFGCLLMSTCLVSVTNSNAHHYVAHQTSRSDHNNNQPNKLTSIGERNKIAAHKQHVSISRTNSDRRQEEQSHHQLQGNQVRHRPELQTIAGPPMPNTGNINSEDIMRKATTSQRMAERTGMKKPTSMTRQEKKGEELKPIIPVPQLNETELAALEAERMVQFAQLQKLYRNDSRIVVVPAVYKEYIKHEAPQWASNISYHEKYNYTTFVYQKLNASLPNYMEHNRGTEGGVYLRYIVDHYHNFPDIAVFVHADPVKHSPNWLDLINCISPNASFSNINIDTLLCTETTKWRLNELWIEQCWRDVLRLAWNVSSTVELNKILPASKPVFSCGTKCCQQFIMSRAQVHRRPLSVWKQFLFMIGEQDVCHAGEPDYENLYAFVGQKIGPEPPVIPNTGDIVGKITPGYHGVLTQGGAMEHLAHVVFGQQPLNSRTSLQDNTHYCANYLPRSVCPGSPCNR